MSRRFELWEYAHDINGNPVSGASLAFYDPGTTTPKDVFSDSDLTTPIAQPLLSNAAGRWITASNPNGDIFLSPALYKVIQTVGATTLTADNYDPGVPAGFGVSSVVGIAQGGTGAGNAAAARSNLGAASSSALTAAQDDITALEAAVATGVNGDGEFGDLAEKDDVSRDELATSFGTVVVQTVDATPYTTSTSLSTAIPADDTIPTSSEGVEILTAAITPATTSNKVKITFSGFGVAIGSSSYIIVALFRGTTCINVFACGSNGIKQNLSFNFIDAPASASSLTYSIRVGPAGANAVYMNGDNSGRIFGGVAACTMRLEELEAH